MTRRLPLMLIHGFNGVPGTWIDSGFRQNLIAQGDLDPDLVRVFHYGIAPDGTYDNRGDLRVTAARLAGVNLTPEEAAVSSLERLSADSVARGGPAQVILIGHSLGGIIATYYLSRRTPDEFGAVYRGNVARVITIGTPHLGIDLLKVTRLFPTRSWPWWVIRSLEGLGLAPAAPSQAIKEWDTAMNRLQMEARTAFLPELDDAPARILLTDSPILRQIAPDSPLLAELRAPDALPRGIVCHSFFGDIRVHLQIARDTDGPALLDRVVSFGDLTVTTPSASYIMGSAGVAQGFITEKEVGVTLRGKSRDIGARSLWEQTPDTAHARLLGNRSVQAAVLALLAQSW
jgi:pimeloyl-ACP methyl ester carboxylesterase